MATLIQHDDKLEYFAFEILPEMMGTIVPLSKSSPEFWMEKCRVESDAKVDCQTHLSEFRVTFEIKSLQEVPLPKVTIYDSEEEKTLAGLNALWGDGAPRFDLKVWDKPEGGNKWLFVGTVALQHSKGYPYLQRETIDLLTQRISYRLGKGQIGISLENAGYGDITNQDIVTVRGCLTHHISVTTRV